MFHDERYYDRPDEFIPERFLKHLYGIKDGVEDDPARRPNLVFGGGKRVCPGIAFAKSSIVCLQIRQQRAVMHNTGSVLQELNLANFIWAFDFLPAIDPVTGKEVYPDLDDHTEVSRRFTHHYIQTLLTISGNHRVPQTFPSAHPTTIRSPQRVDRSTIPISVRYLVPIRV